MRKEHRLRRAADFDAVYKTGKTEGGRLLVVRWRPTEATTRIGFVCTKALGGAVVRNKVKRRLRAIVDSLDLAPGRDIVVSARKSAAEASFAELKGAAVKLLSQSGSLTITADSNQEHAQS